VEAVLAVLTGWLVALSVYLMLSRSFVRYLFGLVILSNAANLILFASGRMTRGEPAIVPPGLPTPAGPVASALPQALILTAIVIGFGLVAFAFVLAFRAREELGTIDTDAMRVAEPPETDDEPGSGPPAAGVRA
jgi:multicomponent Na+:H+ antiporter subunit C